MLWPRASVSPKGRQRKRSLLSSSSKVAHKQTLVDALKAELFPPFSGQISPLRSCKQSLSPTPKHVLIDTRPQSYCLRRKPVKQRKIIPEEIPYVDPKRSVFRLNADRPHSHSESRLRPATSLKRLAIVQIELQPNDQPPRRTYSRALSRLKPQRPHYLFSNELGGRKHATAETNTEEMDFPNVSPVTRVNFRFTAPPDDSASTEYIFRGTRKAFQRFTQRRLY